MTHQIWPERREHHDYCDRKMFGEPCTCGVDEANAMRDKFMEIINGKHKEICSSASPITDVPCHICGAVKPEPSIEGETPNDIAWQAGYKAAKESKIESPRCTVGGHEPPCFKCPHCKEWIESRYVPDDIKPEPKLEHCPCQSVKAKWWPIITKDHWSLIAESDLPNSIKQWLYESLEAVSKCNGQPKARLTVEQIKKILSNVEILYHDDAGMTIDLITYHKEIAIAIHTAMMGEGEK